MINVIKRDGRIVEFDPEKIEKAINKAAIDVYGGNSWEPAVETTNKIIRIIELDEKDLSVEDIQDIVELALMRIDGKVAKSYILYREKRNQLRKTGWEMTDLQRDILEKKYLYKGESFADFVERVGKGHPHIQKMIRRKKFSPAGRILMGRGLNEKGIKVSYSNCFVITPPEDNLESIFDTAKKMARTYSYGGGCGTSLEKLRPRGATVKNAAKSTSGAVSFMDLYSLTTGLIGQASRRGALMLSLPVTHPDIIEFINVKTDLEKVTKANISIMMTDDFMRAVQDDAMWHMSFQVEDSDEVITRKTKARELLKLIATNNWRTAEPGMLFWDRVEGYHLNSENPDFEYASTNP